MLKYPICSYTSGYAVMQLPHLILVAYKNIRRTISGIIITHQHQSETTTQSRTCDSRTMMCPCSDNHLGKEQHPSAELIEQLSSKLEVIEGSLRCQEEQLMGKIEEMLDGKLMYQEEQLIGKIEQMGSRMLTCQEQQQGMK